MKQYHTVKIYSFLKITTDGNSLIHPVLKI